MNSLIVDSPNAITLVGAGAATSDDLRTAQQMAPVVVAADGGAVLCDQAGRTPDAVIGDLDSLPSDLRARLPAEKVHYFKDQDSTDLEKTLRSVRAPLFIGVGFLGARIDHELAAFHALLAAPHQRVILLGQEDVICLCPKRIDLPLAPGTRVSLFPLRTSQAQSKGLIWPLDGLTLTSGQIIATSNRADGPVEVNSKAPGLLLILPRDALQIMAKALQNAAPWPAPAG